MSISITPLRRAAWLFCASLIFSGRQLAVADEAKASSLPQSAPFDSTVKPFLNTYCVKCHGPEQQKGERRFDALSGKFGDDHALVDYQDILDQLNLAEMPPKEARQPTDDERRAVIAWLTGSIDRYHQARKDAGGDTVLRRLNAREYRNTLRDLLHLNMTMFDPTSSFPRDQTSEHLDNVGETLVTSGHLLAQYLAAADQVIEKAITPLEKPPIQTWTFRDGFQQQPEIDQVHRYTNRFEHMTLYDVVGSANHEGAYGPILAFKEGVPISGVYEIRLQAEALNRFHPYDAEFLGTDPNEPLRLGIVAGNHLVGFLHKPQPIEPLLAEIDLADEAKWYTVRIWLDAGFTPRFTFRNGLMDVRELWARLLRKYPDRFPGPHRRIGLVSGRRAVIADGKIPQIRIHEIEIQGPIYETWPTPSQRAVLGDDWESVLQSGSLPREQMRKHLTAFASRAYRRPVGGEEIDRIMRLVAVRQEAGASALEAYSDGLKAVLCSPNFLYLDQPAMAPLSSYALASRLSYFLWSSMPDQELLDLASREELQRPEVLTKQVERMLSDAKSDAFIEGFLDSWLTLRDLGSMPPDRAQFRDYYRYDLGSAMRRETRLFTRHLIENNLSIANFLDSDFTFVDKALAKLYGVAPPSGNDFQLVKLTDRRRGGLLGQASVLTVTANGIDTSPVVRGVWLMENILGTPPSPPPPDVEPLDPDSRGAQTIREQLNKHRNVATCYDCHRKIDPIGFALENFDPIGKWRETYGQDAKIDASGELPNGKSFHDIAGFKAVLVEQQAQFARALTEKLLAYAIGRRTKASDRSQIDRMVAGLAERDGGLKDLIQLVVASETFRSK